MPLTIQTLRSLLAAYDRGESDESAVLYAVERLTWDAAADELRRGREVLTFNPAPGDDEPPPALRAALEIGGDHVRVQPLGTLSPPGVIPPGARATFALGDLAEQLAQHLTPRLSARGRAATGEARRKSPVVHGVATHIAVQKVLEVAIHAVMVAEVDAPSVLHALGDDARRYSITPELVADVLIAARAAVLGVDE